MKRLTLAFIIVFSATVAHAETSIGDLIGGFIFTNSAVDVEGFRGLSGNKYVVAATYAKDITTNAAVLLSYDRSFSRSNVADPSHSDKLTGGLNLNTTLNITTNFQVRIGGFEEAGVITSGPNSGSPVNILGTYVDSNYKKLHYGFIYQNRTETDYFGGNYIGLRAGWSF